MFKKRLITISALPFVTALLLGSSLTISNKPEKVSAINDTHEHNGWTGVTELPTSAGNYYLTADITLSTTWNVPEGTTNLCLNGHVINANGENFSVITMGEATTLIFMIVVIHLTMVMWIAMACGILVKAKALQKHSQAELSPVDILQTLVAPVEE